MLANGKVLVAGGGGGSSDGNFHPLASAALYDPATGTWSATSPMPEAREYHTATRLLNGKVLVAGGWTDGANASAVLYDPATGTWASAGTMPDARLEHTATLLPNGKVLVAGGQYHDGSWQQLSSAALYDPATGAWTATGSMPEIRSSHTATLLPNGKVLVAGGNRSEASAIANATLYDPSTGTWAGLAALPGARYDHTATLLPNGKVLVAGGFDSGNNAIANALLYDPALGTWKPTPAMSAARGGHTAVLLSNGRVLVAGGFAGHWSDSLASLASAELYTPDAGNQAAADFAVTNIILKPASPALNTRFTAAVTVKNQGKTVGNGGKLLVWSHQAGSAPCGADADAAISIGSLDPGTSTVLIVSGLKVATAGVKTFRAFADGGCAAVESNEGNNQRTLGYRAHGTLPDFVVKAITLSPASPKANSAFTATVTVANQGTAAGNPGFLDVWANQPRAQACGAEGDAWAGVGSLRPGEAKSVRLNLLAGAKGARTVRAFVDSWCGAAESDKGNNQMGKGYTAR